MISSYSMYRMLQYFHANDYQELFKEFGFDMTDEIDGLRAKALSMLKNQPPTLYYQAYGKKIWEIYNRIQTTKTKNETVQPPGADMISQVHINNSINPYYQTLAHVKFIELPFYKTISEAMMPIILIGNMDDSLQNILKNVMKINLQLSHEQIKHAIEGKNKGTNKYHMKIRIGVMKNDDFDINDCLPLGLFIQINNSDCPLPAILNENCQAHEIQRTPMQIDCTNYIKLDSNILNNITVSWTPDEKTYVMAVNLTKKKNSIKLITKIKSHTPIRTSMTKFNITNRFMKVNPFKPFILSYLVSLNCPLSKTKMFLPGKSTKCVHLQCFDLIRFITNNERKSTWRCPVCNNPCLYKDLAVDLYFANIISELKLNDKATNIQLLPDGSWRAL